MSDTGTLKNRKKIVKPEQEASSSSSTNGKHDQKTSSFMLINNKTSNGQKSDSSSSSSSSKVSFSYWQLLNKNTFLLILLIRSLSAYVNNVWDCDETYNYWEPLHMLLYGNGFQTWEYSPTYSLRSYLYVWLHAAPVWPLTRFTANKIHVFFALRFVFAVCSSLSESFMYHSLLQRFKSTHIPLFYLLFTITNVGMFSSATAFLPSTFSMYLCMLSYGSLLTDRFKWAVFSIGLAALLGWPFVVILGVPVAFHALFFRRSEVANKGMPVVNNLVFLVKWTVIFAVLIGMPIVLVDSYMFGKWVFAPLNIVLYNVFPSNPNVGPDIYGTEPLSFYVLNCLLNFNVLFPMSLVSGLLLWMDYKKIKEAASSATTSVETNATKQNRYARFIMLGAYLWMFVFFTRPHKEERFLYPIYPLFVIGASITLNHIYAFLKRATANSHQILAVLIKLVPVLVVLVHALLSLSRGVALYKNYHASIDIYKALNDQPVKFNTPALQSKELINVCVSKEWHRFPSSFFIPEDLTINTMRQKWRLSFLESDFKGQLPGKFNESLSLPACTRFIDLSFNDENNEVPERYIDLNKCDFFIDTDANNDDKHVHLYHKKQKTNTKWNTLIKLPFLDAAGMEQSREDKVFRSFYAPYLYETKVKINFFKLRSRIP